MDCLDMESPLYLQSGSWDYAAYLPYLQHLEEQTGADGRDSGSAACLLWAKCLRAAVSDEDWEDREIDDPEHDDMLCRTVCAAFDAYLSEQQQRVVSKRAPPRLCCQSRRSLFVKSVSPDALMDDEHFALAAICFCGGWLLVDGGPRCRSDPLLLASVLECEDTDLDFLLHVDVSLFRKHPHIVRRFPVILESVTELRGEADFMKDLVTMDHCLFRFVDDRLHENQGVVTAAMTGAGQRMLGMGGDVLLRASEVLAGRAPNSRTRRFTSQVARRLVDNDLAGAVELAHQLLLRGRPSAAAAQGGGERCDVEARAEPQPQPRCGSLAEPPHISVLDEEIRMANEAARLAKQRAKGAIRRPKLRNRARKAAHDSKKNATDSESESQHCKEQPSPKTLRPRPPLIISSVDLDVGLQETLRAPTPKKNQQKHLKRAKLIKARVEERRHVAEVFGVV